MYYAYLTILRYITLHYNPLPTFPFLPGLTLYFHNSSIDTLASPFNHPIVIIFSIFSLTHLPPNMMILSVDRLLDDVTYCVNSQLDNCMKENPKNLMYYELSGQLSAHQYRCSHLEGEENQKCTL